MTTEFVGYKTLSSDSLVTGIINQEGISQTAEEGQEVQILTDVTPFYGESGEHPVNLHAHRIADPRLPLIDNNIVDEKRGAKFFRIEDLRVKSLPGNLAPVSCLPA